MLIGKKVKGAIAYMGGVFALPEPFVWSWSQMVEYNADYLVNPNDRIHYERATASYHSFARNTLVQKMQGDWLLMLDTDHVFDPDIAVRMLDRMDKWNIDVLVGMYQYKTPPHSPVLYLKKGNAFEMLGKWDKKADVIEVGSAGAGCLLVKKTVFERIKNELKQEPFDILPPFSEDHSFFKRLHKLKIPAYCDPTIECHHLMMKKISLEDYKENEQLFSKKRKPIYGFNREGGVS